MKIFCQLILFPVNKMQINRDVGPDFPISGLMKVWSDECFIFRAMVVNAAQLASYSQAKQFILGTGYVKVDS